MLERTELGTGPATICYHRGGTHGRPLVLLNALGQDLAPWSRLVDRLLPRRVLVWQPRGLTPPYPGVSFDDHVDDLAAVLAAEGVRSCHLIGWCTGPKLALRYCRRAPHRVVSLVFLNAAFKHPGRATDLDTPYERNLEVLCRALERRPETATRLMGMFPAGGPQPFRSAPTLVAYARQHLDFWSHDPTADIPGAHAPVLFVLSEQDTVVGGAGIRLAAQAFPAATTVEIRGAGHHALHDAADRVGGLIEGFTAAAELAAALATPIPRSLWPLRLPRAS